jgi:hypothetical protein
MDATTDATRRVILANEKGLPEGDPLMPERSTPLGKAYDQYTHSKTAANSPMATPSMTSRQ